MAISVKTKFAGFLRGLISRADDRTPARPVAATAAMPAATPVHSSSKSTPPPVASSAPRTTNPDVIELPLISVVASLPIDLRAKLMATPQAERVIQLQAEMVISQLAFGAVKISFGELRQLAPGIFVNSGGELDNKLVSLPLQEILPRLNPTLLARRAAKKIEVADEIVGPFAGRGKGFSFTTQALKAPAAPPPPPAPEPPPEPASRIAFAAPAATRQVSPLPSAPQIPQRSITPAAPTNGMNGNGHGNGNGHSHPLSVSPLSPPSPRSVTPATSNGNGTNGNGHSNGHNGNGHENGNRLSLPPGLRLGPINGNSRAELPQPMKMSAEPAPAPAAPLPPMAQPAPAQPTIFALLSELCQHWPEELKDEILSSPLASIKVPLEGGIILPGLKRGRVVMAWKQLRQLAQPSSAASPKDNLELELPLKVIAPLFLAAQKDTARTQTKASVSAEIPDLFFGFPQPAVVPVIPPLPPQPAPTPEDTNYYGWGGKGEPSAASETALRVAEAPQTDFVNRQAQPKDVVTRASALPGVAGAVVAMQDGLRVASVTPTELNADTLAAFLPQIYERVNQSTRELRMGVLNNVSFTVGNVPWKIFRVNAVYFAAFGRAGEQLPSVQLAQLAAELDRKKQQ